MLIYSGKVEGCSLQTFEAATGLRLTDQDGTLREDLPAITTFLNRLLALTIALQNTLFEVFEDLLRTRIEGAIASGTYDLGVETVTAESLTVTGRKTIYTHPQGGAETQVFTILRRERNKPLTLAKALDVADSESRSRLLVNRQSGRAAVQVPTTGLMLDDGAVERRVRLMRPMERPAISVADLAKTQWREADRTEFTQAWEAELAALPEFTDSTLHIVTGLLAADLEAAAARLDAGLPAADRCGRAHHRPAGVASLGGAGLRERGSHPQPGRRFRGRAGGQDAGAAGGWAGAAPRAGDGRGRGSSCPASPRGWWIGSRRWA